MPWPFLPPEELERIEALGAGLRETGKGDYEVDLMRADGGRFAALVSAGCCPRGRRPRGLGLPGARHLGATAARGPPRRAGRARRS